ncbi:hypothetical protein Acr_07g0008560 [Actinidia rufa]|uniref:CCHC-type domain-containing protein n=1 Tax=Actinidia rufa TaxID=165716 RepID=A0A7J0EXJ4_9ERIC|nr:hypothetical protein Acr_07g0008560 [Actinidia rufa]
MFKEPLLHIEPFRLKLMGFVMTVMDKIGLFKGCSSRRYGAPTPNRVGNGVRTRPHAPFEDRRVRSVSATHPGRSHALSRARGRTHAPTRAREEAALEATSEKERSRAEQTCPRALTRLHAPEKESARAERGRGQGRGHHRGTGKGRWRSQARGGRTVRCFYCFYCDQEGHIKRDCPKYKAQVQSSDTAATAVMAVDESEVLLAASDDGKSDWVLDSGSAYHLCRDREVFSIYAACDGRIWMANNTSSRVIGRGSVRFRMADRRSVTLTEGKKTGGLYRLEGNVQTGGATVRHGSSGISEKSGQGKQPLHRVQDVHREAQKKETKSILRNYTAKGAVTPKRVSFALDLISGGVLSSCAHKGGEMEPRQLAK